MTPTGPRWRTIASVLAAICVILLAGCGSGGPPDKVSVLSARLALVDDALATHQFAQARVELSDLAKEIRAALAKGLITAPRANRVLGAIIALRATLPPLVVPTPTVSLSPSPRHRTSGPKHHGDEGHKKEG